MPDGLDLDALKALIAEVERLRGERDSLARRCAAWVEESQKLHAEQEAHEGELGDMRAALSAAEADRDREYQRAEGWADQYNRVARQIADLRDERDTALTEAKQARVDARDSQADAWAEVQRLDALLQTVTAERDRRGDELRRAQAAIQAALDCHDDDTRGVCCGQAYPCETVHALREVAADG